jgi:DNA repair ATPase RecN
LGRSNSRRIKYLKIISKKYIPELSNVIIVEQLPEGSIPESIKSVKKYLKDMKDKTDKKEQEKKKAEAKAKRDAKALEKARKLLAAAGEKV